MRLTGEQFARGSSWSREAHRIIRAGRRQALLPQPVRLRDTLYLDALPYQVLNFAVPHTNFWKDKYTDPDNDFGLDCYGMGHRSGML